MGIIYLAGAIISEIFGSTMLKFSAISRKKLSVLGVIVSYLLAFYFLSLTVMSIPLSFTYAAWSGIGTALTAAVGFIIFKERIQRQTIIGLMLLIIGLILLRL
ncbi:QacE family quaternary ammonium compound efflux SMR transporter [Staphylococcus arlettae]|uniref:Small multidrug resistance protein n=2 Tax=Staphylococcus TaxID=1279 RepID=A0A1W5QG25_9STAP|nr:MULTISPECIES: SMR family transporter [Staphylococcus]EJY96100.1 small multidrug resistance protein [Staphylococcus arlettae CVD059]ERF48677.1 quaternary ammonium transporter [Staphylococcus sp. EGD-HP3]KAB2478792.1 QacE family quaternary ammonium compound efflux SMR transporter [Staphylococcus sp. CH99b_3]APY23805.1 small multidrug resistance protein [Staphylococcus arlettae]MCD8816022.1 QacE family quaternary ammonium compound efflux SMR transporter [Staphylococcus arlettae]